MKRIERKLVLWQLRLTRPGIIHLSNIPAVFTICWLAFDFFKVNVFDPQTIIESRYCCYQPCMTQEETDTKYLSTHSHTASRWPPHLHLGFSTQRGAVSCPLRGCLSWNTARHIFSHRRTSRFSNFLGKMLILVMTLKLISYVALVKGSPPGNNQNYLESCFGFIC